MKKCTKCKIEKELTEFYKNGEKYRANCKSCKDKRTNDWRKKNKEQYNAKMREYNKNNYQKLRLQRYKLTVEEHARMLSEQRGVCAICSKPPGKTRPLAVDHDHKTGKVRGLLCYGCNRAMHYIDNHGLLDKLVNYKIAAL